MKLRLPGLHSAGRGGQLQEQAVWPGLFQIFLRKNRRGNRIENHPVWRQIPHWPVTMAFMPVA